MNIQQTETLINRVQAMQSAPENANHEWLFCWFIPTKENHLSDNCDTKEMQKAWANFRAHCKRNNTQLQGVRRIKTTIKHKAQVFEVALLVPISSLESVKNQLNTAFPKTDFKTTVMQPVTEERGVEYIVNKMLRPNHPSEKATFINAIQNQLATQTQQ